MHCISSWAGVQMSAVSACVWASTWLVWCVSISGPDWKGLAFFWPSGSPSLPCFILNPNKSYETRELHMLRRESYATTVSLDKMSLHVRQSLLAFHFPSYASSLPSSIRSSLCNLHNHTCSWKSNHKLKAPLNFLLFRWTEMPVRLYNNVCLRLCLSENWSVCV